MTEEAMTRTKLWRNAFLENSRAGDKDYVELSRTLLSFRENTAMLLLQIAPDMVGYTVHDIAK